MPKSAFGLDGIAYGAGDQTLAMLAHTNAHFIMTLFVTPRENAMDCTFLVPVDWGSSHIRDGKMRAEDFER